LVKMIGVLWNIRGLNKLGRTKCVADLIKHHKLDFISIQETKKLSLILAF
jgi:exonuclease III